VAFRWRIRHKLMLGFGLVLGLMGLMLVGTLEGLLPCIASMKSIDSKSEEAKAAESLVSAVDSVVSLMPVEPSRPGRIKEVQKRINEAKEKLTQYDQQLHSTLSRRRDPDKGRQELSLVEAIRERFAKLEVAVATNFDDELQPGHLTPTAAQPSFKKYTESIKKALADLAPATSDLRDQINDGIKHRIDDAKEAYLISLWIVGTTYVVSAFLMLGLVRFFYRWIFYPVRDLEQGASRVAQGDFDHRIELHSGDEMEQLAAAFNDMTARLREMYGDLEHQVNERSRQLVRSERLASVGFLAAGVAHEINNPLASIAFCSEALESRVKEILAKAPQNAEVITKYLRMIQEEAFRCKAITQRLLEFSRGSDRKRSYTDLAELIQSVLDMVQHLQNYKGRQIIFEPTKSVNAWVNAQEIKSVVLNLVVNALDSMDDGGVLTISLSHRDRMAEMVFTDTGCGMTGEVLENIFEPFFTRSRTGKGTGLGLSISHRVITQHGGEIEAISPGPNQGSTFMVRLPLNPAETVKEDVLDRAAA
jgi:two-component system, NtrC family, sensor kinase